MKIFLKIKMAINIVSILTLFFLNCTKGEKSMEENLVLSDENWKGKTIVEVCEQLGKPDTLECAEYYSAKFTYGVPSVVLTYVSLKKRWYITQEGFVLGVVPIKE